MLLYILYYIGIYLLILHFIYLFPPWFLIKNSMFIYVLQTVLCLALQVQYRSTPLVSRSRDVTGSAALCVRFLNSSAKRLRFHRFLMFVFCSFVFLSRRMSRWCDVDVFLRALVCGLDYSRCFRGFVMKRWRSGENLFHKTSCFCFVFDLISFLFAFIVCGGVL